MRRGSGSQKVFRARLHARAGEEAKDASIDAISEEGDVLLKYRFHKQYRHPTLDTSLTKSRIAGEARALLKCLRCVYSYFSEIIEMADLKC